MWERMGQKGIMLKQRKRGGLLDIRDCAEKSTFLSVLLQSRRQWFILLYLWSVLSADSCMLLDSKSGSLG